MSSCIPILFLSRTRKAGSASTDKQLSVQYRTCKLWRACVVTERRSCAWLEALVLALSRLEKTSPAEACDWLMSVCRDQIASTCWSPQQEGQICGGQIADHRNPGDCERKRTHRGPERQLRVLLITAALDTAKQRFPLSRRRSPSESGRFLSASSLEPCCSSCCATNCYLHVAVNIMHWQQPKNGQGDESSLLQLRTTVCGLAL